MEYSNYILRGSYSPGGGRRIGKSERRKSEEEVGCGEGRAVTVGRGRSSMGEHHYKGRMCPTSRAQANMALL